MFHCLSVGSDFTALMVNLSHHCSYGRGGCGRGGLVWIPIGFIVAVVLALSLGLGLGTQPKDINNTEKYALSDNVIVSYNKDFCQGLWAKSTVAPNNFQSSAMLYLLNDSPLLADRERFNLSESANLDPSINYHSWNFYMNTGSTVSFEACYHQPENIPANYDVIFYLIKSTSNFNKWVDDPDKSHTLKHSYLTLQCQTIYYQIEKDDMYYFVFYLDSHSSTSLDIDFQFDRTVYRISPESVVHDCSFPLDGHSSCSINVPMSSGYTAVLSLNTSLPIDYNDGAEIYINCHPRAWLYAVIVCAVVIPVTFVVILCLAAVCIYIKAKGGANNYSFIGGSTTVTTDPFQEGGKVGNARESTFVERVPTVNPGYSPPTGYGTTPSAPPPPYN